MGNINITLHALDRFSQRGGIDMWVNSGSDLGVMSYLRTLSLAIYSRATGSFEEVSVIVDGFKAEFKGMTFVFSKSDSGHPSLVTVY